MIKLPLIAGPCVSEHISYICIVLSSGGRTNVDRNTILEFSPETEEWSLIGNMKETRRHNRVSVVSFVDYKNWCN